MTENYLTKSSLSVEEKKSRVVTYVVRCVTGLCHLPRGSRLAYCSVRFKMSPLFDVTPRIVCGNIVFHMINGGGRII